MNAVVNANDKDLLGLRLHELSGNRAGIWSVTVSGNWQVDTLVLTTFRTLAQLI
nr:type II toxin-antitoxin system RelE/ParE family toxin [Aliidiomarina indica]